jgi:hypothetical protein
MSPPPPPPPPLPLPPNTLGQQHEDSGLNLIKEFLFEKIAQ